MYLAFGPFPKRAIKSSGSVSCEIGCKATGLEAVPRATIRLAPATATDVYARRI